MAPLSKDLRRRLVRAVEAGSSAHEAARRFEVSPSAAVKIVRRARETGGTAPSLRSVAQNARARLPAEELLAEMASYDGPDPLAELARVLGERLAALEADAEHRRWHRQVVGLMDVFDRAARRPWCSRRDLDAGLLPPHPEGFGAGAPILSSSHQVPPRTEMAVDHGVG